MNEHDVGLFSLNDTESNKLKVKKDNLSNKAKIFIIISLIILCIIIVSFIAVYLLAKSKDNNEEKETKGEIKCIFGIKSISQKTNIISENYEKNSDFDIFIDDKKIDYMKAYKFSSIGDHIIKSHLYSDIQLSNMFKNIDSLISIELLSEKNCIELEFFNVTGFDISSIQSFNKLFYNTKLKDFNYESFLLT